jgi:putative DNA primase/helicase
MTAIITQKILSQFNEKYSSYLENNLNDLIENHTYQQQVSLDATTLALMDSFPPEQESPSNIDKLIDALSLLSPDVPRGTGSFYDRSGYPQSSYWLAVLWAIKSLNWSCGVQLARNWSQSSNRYTSKGFDEAWGSYNPAHPKAISIASLYKRAKELGWKQPSKQVLNVDDLNNDSLYVAIVFPAVGHKNRPLQVTDNLKALLQGIGIVCRYNQIKKGPEIIVPGMNSVLDEQDNTALTMVTDYALKYGLTAARIPEMLDSIAAKNPYCPIQTYINSKPWDGVERFKQLCDQLETSDNSMSRFLIRKWLIQAVAAAYGKNGLNGSGTLVLTGPQGIGKTQFFKKLTSGIEGVFLEGATLNPADKDSVMTACSHWICELGELDATFRKSDLAQLKAFLSKNTDKLRRPYAKKDSNFQRRTVFAGTVNDFQFLHDPTGNRRFWPIEIIAVSRDESIDYQQLWAEVFTWYEKNESWHLTPDEAIKLNHYSDQFLITDLEVERLLTVYNFNDCKSWKWSSMKNICDEIELERPNKSETMRIAVAIRKYNGNVPPKLSNGVK